MEILKLSTARQLSKNHNMQDCHAICSILHENLYLIIFIALLFLGCSCKNGNTAPKQSSTSQAPSCIKQPLTQPRPIIKSQVNTLSLDNISNRSVSISVQNENVISLDSCKENSISLSLLDIVRKCKDKKRTALTALKNNNTLQIKVAIKNEIDTIANFRISPYYDKDVTFSILGKCAPLTSKYPNSTQTSAIKAWLFENKEYLDNDNIHLLCGLVQYCPKRFGQKQK